MRNRQKGWLRILFSVFSAGRVKLPAKAYQEFVETLIKQEYESPLKEVFASTILGGLGFIKAILEKYLLQVRNDRNVPAMTELSARKTVEEIREASSVRLT